MSAKFGRMNGSDRRGSTRYRSEWRVEMEAAAGEQMDGIVLDVSEHGCMFMSPRRIEVGSRIRLRIFTGGNAVFCSAVTVVREAGGLPGQRLYGARFESPEPTDCVILAHSLATLAGSGILN